MVRTDDEGKRIGSREECVENIGFLAVDSWLGEAVKCKAVDTDIVGSPSGAGLDVAVRFEGYLSGPFNLYRDEYGVAWLSEVYDDNRVDVRVVLGDENVGE